MENLVFTQLSITEVRQLFRQELETYFTAQNESGIKSEEDQLFNVKEAAEFLDLTVPTIYGYVHKQEIPVNKRGKRLYFSRKELTEWIKSGRKKTISEISEEASSYIQSKKKGGRR
jgi:excisionase family DNA binding protein